MKLLKDMNVSCLKGLNLDLHLKEENFREQAIDLIDFLSQQTGFSDYTLYILEDEPRSLINKFMQKRLEDLEKKKEENNKRPREEEGEGEGEGEDMKGEIVVGNGAAELKKRKGEIQWMWAADTEKGHQDSWEPYTHDLSQKIERAYQKKQKTVKLDHERYIDLGKNEFHSYILNNKRKPFTKEI